NRAANVEPQVGSAAGIRHSGAPVGSRGAPEGRAVSDLDEDALREHVGPDRDPLLRLLLERLLGMDQQVQKNLLELALRSQHVDRSLLLDQIAQMNPAGLPLALAELDQVAQQLIQLDRL